jgi:heat shock protein HslJ/predicted secreted Zn-dependent protease
MPNNRLAAILIAVIAVFTQGCAGGAATAKREDPRVMPALKFNPNVIEQRGDASYDVFGITPTAIRASLAANEPKPDGRRVLGSHSYWISYSYTTKTALMRCKPVVKFTVQSTTMLPKWKDRDKADSSVRAQWDLFMAALIRHEEGHRVIAIKNVDLMQRRMTALEPPTCRELTLMTRNIFNDVMKEMRLAQSAWDADPANSSSWLVPGGRNAAAIMHARESAPAELSGTEWRAVAIGLIATSSDPALQPTVRFAVDTMRVSGNLGCNRFSGAYVAGDSSAIRFSPLTSTRMACAEPALNAQEAMFGSALTGSQRYHITGDTLSLFRGETPLAKLLRKP